MSDEKHKPRCSEWAREQNGGRICQPAESELALARGYESMTPDQRLAWLRERYRDTYEWANQQPCTSDDFVSVPIESLENLLRGRSDA